jgi:RING finger protein 113A
MRKGLTDPISCDTRPLKNTVVASGNTNSAHILAGEEAIRHSDPSSSSCEDKRSQYERVRDIQKRIDAGELDEGIYRGLNAYRAYVQPDDERKSMNSKITGVFGPSKTLVNVRATSRFDYQADVCKDYKETGYCGFGDSCKFLHDRSDYKTGWELEKEWDESERKRHKERLLHVSKSIHHEETQGETIPEKEHCGVCKLRWEGCSSAPCKTLCAHYFCESCFLKHCAKICPICGKSTEGIFNSV